MPQFRVRPGTAFSAPAPEKQRARALAVIAKGLEETRACPGEPAEITVSGDTFIPHEDDGRL